MEIEFLFLVECITHLQKKYFRIKELFIPTLYEAFFSDLLKSGPSFVCSYLNQWEQPERGGSNSKVFIYV